MNWPEDESGCGQRLSESDVLIMANPADIQVKTRISAGFAVLFKEEMYNLQFD